MKNDPNGTSIEEYRKQHEATHWLSKWSAYQGKGGRHGGTVYFVQHEMGGFIKIGVSTHVPSRLKSLNSQAHDPRYRMLATMPGAGIFYERLFHQCFAHLREHGEWFRPEQDLLDFIAHVQEATHG